MELAQIPQVVLEGALLPYLGWNDLLRLRRVCKATKAIVSDYLRLKDKCDLAPEMEITENDERGFHAFLKMDIPTTKIFFSNLSGYKFCRKRKNRKFIDQFLDRYGSLVKYLRVTQISMYLCKEEWLFFDAFVNLESLEAQFIGGWDERKVVSSKLSKSNIYSVLKKMHKKYMNEMQPALPEEFFSQLRTLKVGNPRYILAPEQSPNIQGNFKTVRFTGTCSPSVLLVFLTIGLSLFKFL